MYLCFGFASTCMCLFVFPLTYYRLIIVYILLFSIFLFFVVANADVRLFIIALLLLCLSLRFFKLAVSLVVAFVEMLSVACHVTRTHHSTAPMQSSHSTHFTACMTTCDHIRYTFIHYSALFVGLCSRVDVLRRTYAF